MGTELLEDNFTRFVKKFGQYTQPAGKQYSLGVLKHIIPKMINEATSGEGKIVIFGDKDPDGIFSSMIMKVYLERLMLIYREEAFKRGDIYVDIRYSNREKDGFGLSKNTYDALSKEYSLIITTDNGTSSGFHSFGIDNLIVTDHHPVNKGEEVPKVPYILNPNLHRKDDLEYSTSGGMVAYDVVKYIDTILREQNKHYREYLKNPDNHHSHTLMMEVLKEYAAFTVVSDMAILDANNRRFVQESLQTARLKEELVPLYLLFEKEYTQNKLSFGIIPKINIDRMGELHTINPKTGKTYMESFIRAKTLDEYKDAEKFVVSVDKKRKEILSRISNTMKIDEVNGILVSLVDEPDARVGLSGLLANRIAQKYGKPAIVAIPTSDKKKLSFSGRGHEIKRVISKLLPKAGGHANACGGAVDVGASIEDVYQKFCNNLSLLNIEVSKETTEVVHSVDKPLSWNEAIALSRIFAEIADGVEMSKPIRVAVVDPKISSYFTYKSGEWGKVGFGQGHHKKEILNNCLEFPEKKLQESKIIIFDLLSNGEFGISRTFKTIEEYRENTKQLQETEGYNIASEKNSIEAEDIARISGAELLHAFSPDAIGDNIFYYSDISVFDNVRLSDAIIIVPSYASAKKRSPYRKRDDVLEFFVGEDENTPLSNAELGQTYAEFAKRLITASKSKSYIFIRDGLLNDPLISDKAREVAKSIIKKSAVKHNMEGAENAKNMENYQHSAAS